MYNNGYGYGLPALIVAFVAGFIVAQFFTLQPRTNPRNTPRVSIKFERENPGHSCRG